VNVVMLLVGVILGFFGGLIAAGPGSGGDQAQEPQTVTKTKYVTVHAPQGGGTTPSASASSSASSAGIGPQQATKDCRVGEACDLGPSTVTVQNAQKTTTITPSYATAASGNFVVVRFTYTWQGTSPTSLGGEIPWTLTDGDGKRYTYDFDVTNNYASDQNMSTIYEQVQPGVANRGLVVFSVSPNAEDFTLTITDLATPQAGEAANVKL
jgi:hypothetical protein